MTQTHRTDFADKRRKTRRSLLSALLTVLLLYSTTASVIAQTEFQGSLKSVSITDSAGTNIPPIANFTYTQDGESFTFNANGSSDSDGSITKYKWDLGNGETREGVTTTYTVSDFAKFQVTLAVIDNNNGVALTQQIITPASKGVADNFSTDSSSDYTILSGGLTIYDGTAHSSGAWTTTYAIHNKELASIDHFVEADVYTDGASATGGLMFRVNKVQKTGYLASFANGNIVLSSYSAGTKKWLASFPGNFAAGTYQFRAEISGSSIKIYVNGNLTLQSTSSNYTTGSSVGLYIEPYGKNALITIDNLAGI